MMIRPFLFDVRRTLTSKSVLIITAIILLISLTIIPLATPRIANFNPTGNGPYVLYYYSAGGFHFLVFSEDQYGNPISEWGISLNLYDYQGSFNQTVPVQTNSSGVGTVVIAAPTGNYQLTVSVSSANSQSSASSPLVNRPLGEVAASQGSALTTVTDRSDASKRDLQVIYAGPYGVLPTGYSVYFKLLTPHFTKFGPFNETEMTFFQNLTSYHQVFDLPFLVGASRSSLIWLAIFRNGNATAVESTEFGYEVFRPRQSVPVATDVASFFFSGVLSFFVPLVAIIGSYSSYGKDRITGVLESVLARPITRRGLAISRFLSTILAISIATFASVGIVDLILNSLTGSALSASYVLAIIGGLSVEIAAFTGLVFLFSHLFKSTGALLGLSIGLFIFLDLFWGLIIFLLTAALGGTQGSAVSLQATILSYYANPAQFINLVNIFFFQSTSGTIIQASNYGLTLPGLVLAGVLWSVAPFTAFMYLAVKRD